MAAADLHTMGAPELRCTLDALYADYAGCLNDEAFEQWPDFFTADCVYRIIPRENFSAENVNSDGPEGAGDFTE